ncbi:proton channel OTOP1-like [Megalops cyprinoides]|uniref:proton channel OTOP1-like n=1 Tax=Megalops cyprinoides TaxID=118141 RepID=UPI001863B227|nr:proton channel OTOP1-like [Megalops cyprinoides]
MDLSAIVEHGGFDVMCFNKYCNNCSSSTNSEEDKSTYTECKAKRNYPKNNAEILSGQYGINVFLVGVALMLAVAHHGPSIKEKHLLSFVTALMLVQLLWMLWYVVKRDRQKKTSEKDAHAGMSWIRAGVTVLALLSLIMDAFRIGRYVGYRKCMSAALVVYPVVHALHTVSQVHFLWYHVKDVIKSFETFERFGVIHAVFTNLFLWCNGAMTESEHFLNDHKRRLSELGYANLSIVEHKPYCNCTTSACSMFSKSLYYLYPFNIEYHIFVSAMLFVMWKNIGRTIHHYHDKARPVGGGNGLGLGPALGLVALAGTIGVLAVYTVHMEDSQDTRDSAISMFYYHGIVLLGCMAIAGVVGLLIYRVDRRPLDDSKNPSRQLDKEMLFGASVGTWLMSWCSVVAVGATETSPRYRWPNLAYSLLLILEKSVQNLFIIESLYRKHEANCGEGAEPATNPSEIFSVAASLATPFKGVFNRAYENQDGGCISLDGDREESKQVCVCPLKHPVLPFPVTPGGAEPPSRQRQALRNITIFLILCNISLWLLPAFGCRPQYDNGLEQEILGFTIWTMVLNFAMPLNLFYRMHAVASLLEVFKHV